MLPIGEKKTGIEEQKKSAKKGNYNIGRMNIFT